jgi:hypothetical protein
MTDRLRTLLHDEVESLEIPPVPATDILGTGRRLRRRRTGTIWASAVLAVAVVAGGTAAARSGGDDHSAPPVTDTPAPPEPGTLAWSLDDLVYVVQDGRLIAGTQVPEVAQTLYYTSAGILVRTNRDGSSDGGAPFHFRLIGHDGELTPVNVTLGEVVPSTDSAEPYLAWATQEGGRIQVVVHDVVSGHDVGRVDVPGTFTWGGWEAPPVALSGDLVYVATDDQTAVVNWRTGEVTTTAVVPAGQVPEVSGGRAVTVNRGRKVASADVVDVATGRDLLDIPVRLDDQVTLSPDGRFVQVVSQGFDPPARTLVYDVDTAHSVQLPDTLGGYAWTSGGDLFEVRGDQLDVCSPVSGSCDSMSVPKFGRQFLRYSGRTYES